MPLFLILVAVPIIEIALFIQVGGFIGLWPTLAIVVATALAGTILLRSQGIATLNRLQSSMREGRNPAGPMAHGALILIAGILLLTPGFFTDAVALLLLVPPIRSALIKVGTERFASRVHVSTGGQSSRSGAKRNGTVIDGEYTVDEPENGSGGNSGWTNHR